MDGLRFVNVRPNFPGESNRFPRPRPVTSCLQCRRRKVRCDRTVPQCSSCRRGNYYCSYGNATSSRTPGDRPEDLSPRNTSRGRQEFPQPDILARLQRLEALIERAADNSQPTQPGSAANHGHPHLSQQARASGPSSGRQVAPDSTSSPATPALSSDGLDGTLLLEGGQSHYVSSVHWALLADEIHDIRTLLGDQTEDEPDAVSGPGTQEGLSDIHLPTSLLFGTPRRQANLACLLPRSLEDCHFLLSIFFSNVDPMTRIVHKPSLSQRFALYVEAALRKDGPNKEKDSPSTQIGIRTFEPLAFAILYSAVNSMKADQVQEKFGMDKMLLLKRFQKGAELSLEREDVLTTSSLEVLQGFVLLITSQFREDNLGKAWPLTGLAIRIAIDQGLHREPSLFPSGNMDAVQAELRRRIWHQLCHLDWRSAEGKGHEPAISDDDFTTLLPQHINDDDLAEGAPPSIIAPVTGFTDMTTHLIRLNAVHCFRKVIRSTYRLERRIKSSTLGDREHVNPVLEIRNLYQEIRIMVDTMLEKQQTLYVNQCDPKVPLQRLAIGLAAVMEWKCWVIFWLRLPRAYRETVMSADVRTTIFEKSVMLIEHLMAAHQAKETEQFQWHIGGHSAFQAIMHVLSELKTPEFNAAHQVALRARALSALQRTRKLKEKESSKTWKVVRRMIDRIIPSDLEYTMAPNTAAQPPTGGFAPPRFVPATNNEPPHSMPHELTFATTQPGDAPRIRSLAAPNNPAAPLWENTGDHATLADAPDLAELSGEFDWGWWNLDSLPWSPSG